MDAEAQHGEHDRVDLRRRATRARLDDAVVEPLSTDGAEGQLRGERRVAATQIMAREDLRHLEVGVGTVVDGAQDGERRTAGGITRAPAR